RTLEVTKSLSVETGLVATASLTDLIEQFPAPRVVWLMLPAGKVTEEAIEELATLLAPGDILVDGANSFYQDTIRISKALTESGILFVDAGVSGGIFGLEDGYCLMVGGDDNAVETIRPFLQALAPAPDRGWLHAGPSGAGHFAKMVHNGIEYGMMQALAEGLSLLNGKKEFNFDVAKIAELWRHGSVVRSWLLDLTAQFLSKNPALDGIAPKVADSGEGRWTAIEAIEQGIPLPAISSALFARFSSQSKADYAAKLLAMMRHGFGGHDVQRDKSP
ncbi:MAG TPA: decarboxylating 6-phosphogluconate dehydrogenase, partial [Burkholderiales bacterium]|nr:decarboxylating 6-phosphogluconate dehydrogenase [Burkholderiales bacterium]